MPGSSRCAAVRAIAARTTGISRTYRTITPLSSLRDPNPGFASAPMARRQVWRLLLATRLSDVVRLLARPHPFAAMPRTAHCLRRRFGLDAPASQPLGKRLTPAAQVLLARVQARAVAALGAHADVHMRVRLVDVQDHHVAVHRQFGLGEFAGRLLHDSRVGPRRHRQHDVEGLAALADLRDASAAEPPLIGDVAQRFLAFAHNTAVVLDGQSP